MAARAYWQGQIRLALVSIPVEIYPATKSGAAISFHQIHEPTGKRIQYEKVVAGVGPVDRDEIIKGYEVSKGNYVLLDEDEIEAVKIESRKTLDLVQFVQSDDLAEEAYIVLREALRQAKKVAVGQLSVRGREALVSIKPCGRGLVMEQLRYADEVKAAQGFFREIGDEKPAPELLELATTLIDKKTAPFDPKEFHDRYVDALKGLIDMKVKAKGKKILEDVSEPETRGGNVIDLMAALKKSVGSGGGGGAPAKEPAKPPAKKPATKAAAKKTAAQEPAKAPARKRA
jgi:DNA end-binding protein Ku